MSVKRLASQSAPALARAPASRRREPPQENTAGSEREVRTTPAADADGSPLARLRGEVSIPHFGLYPTRTLIPLALQ